MNKWMKFLAVLGLLGQSLLFVFLFNKVAALAKDDVVKNVNFKDINLYNASTGTEAGNSSVRENTVNTKLETHSRAKRFIAFPVGSSFSTAVCMTTGVIGNPRAEYLSMGLNWGIAYDLPNSTWILQHANGFSSKEPEEYVSPQIKRRHRRDLYAKLETLISSFPKQKIFTREIMENSDIELYDRAYRRARSISDCSEEYHCGFSLLELAFGKYSTPPNTYFRNH